MLKPFIKILIDSEPFNKFLGGTEDFQKLRGTPLKSLNGNKLLVINGILTSLKKFKLDFKETLVVLRKPELITKAFKPLTS